MKDKPSIQRTALEEYEEFSVACALDKKTLVEYCLMMYSRDSEYIRTFKEHNERQEQVARALSIDTDAIEKAEKTIGRCATRVFMYEGEADFMVWYSCTVALQQLCEILRNEIAEQNWDDNEDETKTLEAMLQRTVNPEKASAVYEKKATLGSKVMALRREVAAMEKFLFAGDAESAKLAMRNADSVVGQRRRAMSKAATLKALNGT